MITVKDLTARAKEAAGTVDLGPLSFTLEASGSYALVGAPRDGVELLLAVLAGAVRPRKGAVTVAGLPASRRPTVAHAPYLPELPDVLRVDDYLSLAAKIRGESGTPPRERLAALGVGTLAERRIGGLALEESRTVALVEALTSQATFIFLAEPLVDLDPRAVGRVGEALEARVDAGAIVVFSTASPADARALGREQLHFEAGKLVRRTTGDEAWKPVVGPRGARLFIRSEGARLLLAELASDPTFDDVEAHGAELVVTGKDVIAMAAAVATATRRANVELDLLTFETEGTRTTELAP